jgi:hypothetical protein
MKIVKRKIDDLIGAEYNPRELTDKQYKDLKDSLKRFGVVDPVIVNKHPERMDIIVGGHQRSKVWKDLGNDTISTVEVELSPEKEKELNIRLNKNTGQFDMDALANYFESNDLIEWGFDDGELVGWDVDPDEFGEDFELPDGEKEPFQQMTFTLADEQAEHIKNAIDDIKKTDDFKYCETFGNENSNGNAIYLIITQWMRTNN